MSKYSKPVVCILLVTLLAGTMLFVFPTGSVFAQTEEPDPTATPSADQGEIIQQKLAKGYDRMQDLLVKQSERLTGLDDMIQKAQTKIDLLKGKGLDTTALEIALTAFIDTLPAIENAHEDAAAILEIHAGFGDDGSVTDIAAARETLRSAREAMNEVRDLTRRVMSDSRQALRAFREANPRPEPVTASATPTA